MVWNKARKKYNDSAASCGKFEWTMQNPKKMKGALQIFANHNNEKNEKNNGTNCPFGGVAPIDAFLINKLWRRRGSNVAL